MWSKDQIRNIFRSSSIEYELAFLQYHLLLKVRKLADLYFMMKMYKSAYNYYYIAKKDFQVIFFVRKHTGSLSLWQFFAVMKWSNGKGRYLPLNSQVYSIR